MSRSHIFFSALAVSIGCVLAHVGPWGAAASQEIAHARLVFGVLNIWILAAVLLLTYNDKRT